MGPVILARAGLRVRDQGARLGPLLHGAPAPRALRALRPRGRGRGQRDPGRLGAHRRATCSRRVGDPGLRERTRLGPPGVDVERFRPAPGPARPLAALARARRASSRRSEPDDSLRPRRARAPRRRCASGPRDRPGSSSSASCSSTRAWTCWSRPGRWSTASSPARGCCWPASATTAGRRGADRGARPGDLDAAREVAARPRLEGGRRALPILARSSPIRRGLRRGRARRPARSRSAAGSSTTRSPR